MTRMTIALAACLMLTAASAHAATQTDHATVRSGDLKLSSATDAQKMMSRLERASLEVCGAGFGSARAVVEDTKGSDCYLKALSTAVQSAKAPALDQIFAAAHPQSSSRLALANR